MVWTDSVFRYFSGFLASLIDHSSARFRLVANRCPADEIARMEAFATRHPDAIVEVLEVSSTEMLRHGHALDAVLAARDDGGHFAFIDPDILATGPYMPLFLDVLESADAVTSGAEVWSDGNVLPEGKIGLNGEYFFDSTGYVFGSPHLAIYDVATLRTTLDRWGVGFGSAGNDITDETRARLVEVGQDYWIYDTAKMVNILFQEDGHRLRHVDQPSLLHIGGMLHYFSAPMVEGADGELEPDWARWEGVETRYEVAHYTAQVLRDLGDGKPPPAVPTGATPDTRDVLVRVRQALIDLTDTYGVLADTTRRPA